MYFLWTQPKIYGNLKILFNGECYSLSKHIQYIYFEIKMGYLYIFVQTDHRYWKVKGHIHVTICMILCVRKEDEKKEKLSDVVELNQSIIITSCLHKRHFVTFKISANCTRYIIMQKNVSEG